MSTGNPFPAGVPCWVETLDALPAGTGDADRASAFYGNVFGWRTEPFAAVPGVALFRLPGYVGVFTVSQRVG